MFRRHILALCAGLLLFTTTACADSDDKHDERDQHYASRDHQHRYEHDDDSSDHERAAKALGSGQVKPLREILDKVAEGVPGEVVGVEFEQKDGKWIYEIKLVSADSRYLEVYVDAHSGETLRIEGK